MPFWTLPSSEPKRAHRFIFSLDNLSNEGGYAEYLVKSVTKPTMTLSETPHKFLGNTYYYPGTMTWEPITAVIINSVAPDANETFYAAMVNSGYVLPNNNAFQRPVVGTQAAGYPGTPNKSDARATVGDVRFSELNGQGLIVGEWVLQNAFFTSVNFGNLDYDTDDLLTVEVGIRYDWAAYHTGDRSAMKYGVVDQTGPGDFSTPRSTPTVTP